MFELNSNKFNKFIKKFINNLNKNTVIIYISKNFLEILIYLLLIVFVGYCYIYLSFDVFNASNIYNVRDLSRQCFLSMQYNYRIFRKDFWHIRITDIFSKDRFYTHYLEYIHTERAIPIFDDREFNNSNVRTVRVEKETSLCLNHYNLTERRFIEDTARYNPGRDKSWYNLFVEKLRFNEVKINTPTEIKKPTSHVITTNEEYLRCLRLYEKNYSTWSIYCDMSSIKSDDAKFLFVQERMKWQGLEQGLEIFLIFLSVVLAIKLGIYLDNLEQSSELVISPFGDRSLNPRLRWNEWDE